ncbi:hypothetical protein J132_04340 [Termitomyces sp. J132]|nr:hypothetical protein J132_04340 [Termitomyces sp. J132]
MATTFHSPIPLDSKLGAAFLGNLVAGIFYGITCVQAYMYFIKNSRKDEPWFKGIIFFLWLLDTVHLAFITHGLYVYMVSNFGNLAALAAPPWFVSRIIHDCDNTERTHNLMQEPPCPDLRHGNNHPHSAEKQEDSQNFSPVHQRRDCPMHLWSSRLANDTQKLFPCYLHRFNFNLHIRYWSRIRYTSVRRFHLPTQHRLIYMITYRFSLKEFKHFSKISYFLYTSLGSGVAADLLIAGSLCFSLSQRKTGFKKTDSLVTVLIMYTINTSLLTTICSAACFITYTIWPNEFTFIGIYFSLSKLFLNSLLATLNGRDSLSGKLGGVSNVSQLSNMDSDFSFKPSQSRRGPSVLVSIDRQVVKDYEMESTHKGLAI